MIKVICLGKIKEKYLIDLISDYEKRINKYHQIKIIELKDNENIEIETNQILKQIKADEYNIVLDIQGDETSSEEFANIIEETFTNSYGNITFIIGGSNGLSNEVKEKSKKIISFGKITHPHGLFRGILLEQIYRSFKIINNEKYHK